MALTPRDVKRLADNSLDLAKAELIIDNALTENGWHPGTKLYLDVRLLPSNTIEGIKAKYKAWKPKVETDKDGTSLVLTYPTKV